MIIKKEILTKIFINDICILVTGAQTLNIHDGKVTTLSEKKTNKDLVLNISKRIESFCKKAAFEQLEKNKQKIDSVFLTREYEKVEIIRWDEIGDGVVLKIRGERVKFNKKYVTELYENRLK